MVWRRLPTFFPNFSLRMLPLAEEQLQQLRETGWIREAAFRTEPRVNKLEIKAFLEGAYGVAVERVHTINYMGKKKVMAGPQGKPKHYRRTDWKKAYVIFSMPPHIQAEARQAALAAQQASQEAAAARQQEAAAARAARARREGRQLRGQQPGGS